MSIPLWSRTWPELGQIDTLATGESVMRTWVRTRVASLLLALSVSAWIQIASAADTGSPAPSIPANALADKGGQIAWKWNGQSITFFALSGEKDEATHDAIVNAMSEEVYAQYEAYLEEKARISKENLASTNRQLEATDKILARMPSE